jgi:hypothetical protein
MMVTALQPAELQELQHLMIQAVDSADNDVADLRARVQVEQRLARTTKAQTVRLSRRSVSALAAEAQKRIERGHYPSTASMVDESVQLVYGERL